MKNEIKIYQNRENFIPNRPDNNDSTIRERVESIIREIKSGGDKSLFSLIQKIDGYQIDTESVKVSNEEFIKAESLLSDEFKQAIATAKENIEKFHAAQLRNDVFIETTNGVELSQRRIAIPRVGLYIPGGTAPLFSTVLMCGVPAAVAGCKEVIISTPANSSGKIAPEILYTASICGIKDIYKVGGAMAVAAMAYGTESIEKVDKIFGPGNRYVTYAKQLVANEAVSIDMPAGPSEVMVLADQTANAEYVAADLLSQLEHGGDSQAIAVVTSEDIAINISNAISKQLEDLNRVDILAESIKNCHIIIESDRERMLELANSYAAEHLIVSLNNADEFAYRVENAGSIFIGNYSPESVGDYASGTNHTLPTAGWAKSCSGVNTDSFSKYITYQKLSSEGLRNIASTVMIMAEHEGLTAHKNAVKIRLQDNE